MLRGCSYRPFGGWSRWPLRVQSDAGAPRGARMGLDLSARRHENRACTSPAPGILATWPMPADAPPGILVADQMSQAVKGGAPGQPPAIGVTLDGPLLTRKATAQASRRECPVPSPLRVLVRGHRGMGAEQCGLVPIAGGYFSVAPAAASRTSIIAAKSASPRPRPLAAVRISLVSAAN
jgi:hypothetical protein